MLAEVNLQPVILTIKSIEKPQATTCTAHKVETSAVLVHKSVHSLESRLANSAVTSLSRTLARKNQHYAGICSD